MTGHAVYTLCDPQTMGIRYVGYSKRVNERYKAHLLNDTVTHRGRWVGKLIRAGLAPVLRVLCIVQGMDEAKRVEIALIASYRKKGTRLTNSTSGGDGVSGTPEVRAKQALAAMIPCTEEKKAKISATLIGRPCDAERRAVLTKAARSMTPEQIANRNKQIAKAWTPEVRAKAGAAVSAALALGGTARGAEKRRGRKATDEHRMAISKALTGRKQSKEHAEKHRLALTGYKHTPEARANMGLSHLGSMRSEETRAKQSSARKAYWARKKATGSIPEGVV